MEANASMISAIAPPNGRGLTAKAISAPTCAVRGGIVRRVASACVMMGGGVTTAPW
jgi:hypothetical protein